jgi:hypothetical protein
MQTSVVMTTRRFRKRDDGSVRDGVKRLAFASSIRPFALASAALFVTLSGRECLAQEAQPAAIASPVAVSSPSGAPSPSPVAPYSSSKQTDEPKFEEQTLLGGGRIDHGGYGGPLVKVSSFDGNGALFVGGRGGWLINHRLLVGGAGLGQTLNVSAPPESRNRYPRARNVEFGYGGFLLGYHVAPERPIHGIASVLLAGGGLVLSNRDADPDTDADVGHDGDGVFVMEPELAIEANLLRFMRVELSLSYRIVWDVELAGLGNGDASGIGGGLAFLFGDF